MNHLIAKIKGRGIIYKKIISDKTPYSLPENLANPIQYSPDHNLDDDYWFAINDFSNAPFCLEFLKKSFNSTTYDTVVTNDLANIEFICAVQNNNEYYFQKISSARIVAKKWFYIGESVSYEDDKKIILINDCADAIFNKNEDRLYFRKLTTITSIFRGIDQLYRQATDTETAEFLTNNFIQLENEFCVDKVKKANRHRISLAMNTLKSLNEAQKSTVFTYIQEYCPTLERNDQAFNVKSEDDLKLLLYGIEQRYYTTPVGEEKRLANSIIRI